MDDPERNTIEQADYHGAPGFIEGTEVARARVIQPGFEEQLPLAGSEPGIRSKLTTAAVVIAAVFFGGMIAGAVLGIFI